MAKKHYKNEKLMRFLIILGAIVGFIWVLSGILDFWGLGFVPIRIADIHPLGPIFTYVIGIFVVIFTFILGTGKLLPFHWIVMIIFAVLLVVFGADIISCALLIIAALIGIIGG